MPFREVPIAFCFLLRSAWDRYGFDVPSASEPAAACGGALTVPRPVQVVHTAAQRSPKDSLRHPGQEEDRLAGRFERAGCEKCFTAPSFLRIACPCSCAATGRRKDLSTAQLVPREGFRRTH